MFASSPEPASELVESAVSWLVATFGLRDCRYESFPFDVQLPRIEPGRIVLPAGEPGVPSWSLDMGVELPVRHRGLTLGRYVLLPASPTTGVELSPASRAEATSMVVPLGTLIAAAMIARADEPRAARA